MSNPIWKLPGETVPQRTLRGTGRVVGATFVGILAVNFAALIAMQGVTTNLGIFLVETKFELADSMREPVDWIFVGDSTCNQGLSPQEFEVQTGQTAINLCTTGNMTVVGDVWVLQRALDAAGPPRRGVLVTHVYDAWARDEETLRVMGQRVPGTNEWRRDRALMPADFTELANANVGRFFPLLTRPRSVDQLIFGLVRERPTRALDERGFMDGGAARPSMVRQDVREHLANDDDPAISELNRRALAAIDDAVDVPVWIASAPMVDELWADEGIRERVRTAFEGPHELAEARPGLRVLRSDPWRYRADQMSNADHLDGPTAVVHTRAVVEALRAAGALD